MKKEERLPDTVLSQLEEDEESLDIYVKIMREFDALFSREMIRGSDFTIRLEVHGNRSRLLHCRCYQDVIARPKKAGSNRK